MTLSENGILRVRVPDSYTNSVCGLCGDFNGNPDDDLRTAGGTDVSPSAPEVAGAQIAGSYLLADSSTP